MTRTRARGGYSQITPFRNRHCNQCFQSKRGKIRVLPMCLISVKRAKISSFTWLTRACARTSVLKCAFRRLVWASAKRDCCRPAFVVQSSASAKKYRPENTQHPICVASAAVHNETGNFSQRQRLKTRPNRACLKAFFEGIPVPVVERE